MLIVNLVSISIALVSILVAARIDLRSSRIPNWLTLATIAAGAALLGWRCLAGYPITDALIICIASYVLVYVFWLGGLWGGGDAKAVLGISLLASPLFFPLAFLAIYLACLSVALFIRHYIGGALTALASLDIKKAALALAPLPCPALAILLINGQCPVAALVLGFFFFAVLADLVSGTMPYSEKISLEADDAVGRMLMENIYTVDGSVVRVKKRPGFIMGFLDGLSSPPGRRPVWRSHRSLSREDIDELRRYVDEVEVAIQRPMGPSLAAAFIVTFPAGMLLLQVRP